MLADVSENLYLSQSYVSQIITQAEHDYGIKLVNRSSMPISLTEAGGSLAKGLDKVISAYSDLQLQMKTLSSNQKDITVVGYVQPIDPFLACDLYHKIYTEKLADQLKIVPVNDSQTLDRLKSGSIDFYIGPQVIDRQVTSEILECRQLSLLVPFGSKYDQELPDSLNLEQAKRVFSTAQFVGSKKDMDNYGVLKRFLAGEKIDASATIQVNNQWDAALIAHKSGLLALVDPALIGPDAKKYGRLFSRFVKLPAECFSFNIYLSYLTRKLKDKLPIYQQIIAAANEKESI